MILMITKINLNKPFCVLLSCALTVLSCQNVLASKLPDRFLHLIPCPKGLKHAKAINIKKQIRFRGRSFSGGVSIRRENEPDSVVKLDGNDNKDVRQGRDKYIEKSERTYFQYVPTIQIK